MILIIILIGCNILGLYFSISGAISFIKQKKYFFIIMILLALLNFVLLNFNLFRLFSL
jgi:hypothetical protein